MFIIVTIKSHRSGHPHQSQNHYGDLHSQELINNFHWSHAPIIYHYGWVIWWLMRRIICWWALRADFHLNFRSGKLARKWLQFLLENMTNCLETFCNLFHNLWNSKQLLPKALYSALHLLCTHSTHTGRTIEKLPMEFWGLYWGPDFWSKLSKNGWKVFQSTGCPRKNTLIKFFD